MKIGQYCQWQRCRHAELKQFRQAFASRGFVSDSWAFLLRNDLVTKLFINCFTVTSMCYSCCCSASMTLSRATLNITLNAQSQTWRSASRLIQVRFNSYRLLLCNIASVFSNINAIILINSNLAAFLSHVDDASAICAAMRRSFLSVRTDCQNGATVVVFAVILLYKYQH